MQADVTRRREVDGRVELDVRHGSAQYAVTIVPARDMNHQVVGYRVILQNATLLHPSEEVATRAALIAIERIRTGGAGAAPRPVVADGVHV